MKKIAVILILTALFCILISCGEQESPPAYLPSVRYENVPIDDVVLLEHWGQGTADGEGPAFGKTAEEIVADHCQDLDFPLIFNIPAGHLPDNRALRMGCKIEGLFQDNKFIINSLNYA